MKAKLLRRFRKRYHVGRSSRYGYDFCILDHDGRRVDFLVNSADVANFCALKMLGYFKACEHEARLRKRQEAQKYYRICKQQFAR